MMCDWAIWLLLAVLAAIWLLSMWIEPGSGEVETSDFVRRDIPEWGANYRD
jgi:hypothetical protein